MELAASGRVMQAAEALAVHFSANDSIRYQQWRDRAIGLGSKLALVMRREDQGRG